MTDVVSTQAAGTLAALNAPGNRPTSNSMSTLDQGDFLRLLTVQLQQQDPLEPVDNQQMLAQMAQFSGLAGTTETNATLEQIATKIDALISAQQATLAAAERAAQAALAPTPANSTTA